MVECGTKLDIFCGVFVKKQSLNFCQKSLAMHLTNQSPKILNDMVFNANQYLQAHDLKLNATNQKLFQCSVIKFSFVCIQKYFVCD